MVLAAPSLETLGKPLQRHLKSVKTRDVFPLGLLRVVDPIAHIFCSPTIADLGDGPAHHW